METISALEQKNATLNSRLAALEEERDSYGFRAIDAEDKLEKLSSLAGTVLASIKSSVPGGLSSNVPTGVSSEAPKPEIEAQPQGASEASKGPDSYHPTQSGEHSSTGYTPYTIASEARTDQGHVSKSDMGESAASTDTPISPPTANSSTANTDSIASTADHNHLDQRDIPPTVQSTLNLSPTASTTNVEMKESVEMPSSSAKPYAGMLYRDWLHAPEGRELIKVNLKDFIAGGGKGPND